MGYGIVMLVGDDQGIPDPVPAFSNLGYNSLIKPQALHTFAVAAAKRYPYVKYWRMFCEQYAMVPGYAEAYVADEKAFYEGIKSVIPDATIILDNSGLSEDAAHLRDLGVFNYCDAIDPHLYGPVEPVIFQYWLQEKQLLESWGIHKRWISLEFAPFGGGGARGITQQWVSEELPKTCLPSMPWAARRFAPWAWRMRGRTTPSTPETLATAGWGPTVNYYSDLRLVEKLGLTPAVGSFTLGDGPRVRYNRFADAQHTVIVAWSREGDNTIKLATNSPVTVTDNVRTVQTLQPQAGACYVTVGSQPVYLEGAQTWPSPSPARARPRPRPAAGPGWRANHRGCQRPRPGRDTASVLLPPG